MDLLQLKIKEIRQGLIKKQFSAQELIKAFLKQAQEKNKEINAFLEIDQSGALEAAQEIDRQISQGKEIGLLAGLPLAVKDNILVKGMKCTAGSKILENYVAPYQATVIKHLCQAGAIILGKTNLDEFAMGSSTENSAFGPTKNPHDLTRVPGGSSGGSAAALAVNGCLAALGSDTGGSVRQPASFCGLVGLKPTYGAVSRYGLIALASSLDQIGPLAQRVEDLETIFQVISQPDPLDSTNLKVSFKPEKAIKDLKSIKIGLPKEYFVQGLDQSVEALVRKAIREYEQLGAEIVEISLPHTQYALPVYYIIMSAEASANLARYDGIKYGFSQPASQLLNVYFQSRGQGFGREVRRRIILGTYALSAGYYQAYYLKAQQVRALIKDDFVRAFKRVDFILTPTTPTPAFKLGEKLQDPVAMYLSDVYTCSANLAGLPALSLPCGQVNGLPVGFQLIGNYLEENKIFKLAKAYERAIS